MDKKIFLENLTRYYGICENEFVLHEILNFLDKSVNEKKNEVLYRYILFSHSVKFGFPGVSEIYTAFKSCEKDGNIMEPDKPKKPVIERQEITEEEKKQINEMFKNLSQLRRF